MKENINPTLRAALDGNYKFRFENYISRGFDITGRFTGGFMGFAVLQMVLGGLAQAIPMVGMIVGPLVIAPVLLVGYYIIAHRISLNKGYDFENFFDGFKEIGPLVLVNLPVFITTTLIPLAIGYFLLDDTFLDGAAWIETYIDNPDNFDPFAFLSGLSAGLLLFLIPIFYFLVAWSFAPMFVIFYKMQPWDALETSRKLITKRWFTFFGFSIVLILIAMVGILLLCVGIFYFYPAVMNAYYVAFEDITKFYEDFEEDDIMDHLVGT